MKKILVPCDFSDSAVQAFRFALEIAQQGKGEIILLHIIEMPVLHNTMLTFEGNYLNELKGNAEKYFEKMKTKWVKDDVKVRSYIEQGSTAETINRFAQNQKASSIVMGTQGATGVKEFFVGSNTEKVVRYSQVPVIAVRQSIKFNQIKNIVFPTTLRLDEGQLISRVKKLQTFFSATLHLLLVNTPHNMNRSVDERLLMEKYAKQYMLEDYTLNTRNDFSVPDAIINFTHEIKADMIAMGTHSRKGLAHLVAGSVTEDVVNHISCPIWTYSIVSTS